VLRRLALRPISGARLTLIAREPLTPYSGMLPALLRGDCAFDEADIDCAGVAAAAGARLVVAAAQAIDLAAGRVTLADGSVVAFDLLSINVGGAPAMPDDGGVAVKPIGRFLAQLAALETGLPDGARIAVVGGGAGGTEMALALAHRLCGRARVALVGRNALLLPGAPERARRIARTALAAAGVDLLCGASAIGCRNGELLLADGRSVPVAATLWATGVAASAFLGRAGLACDAAGCVRVAPTLQSLNQSNVFAAGDCAAIEGAPRPKSGVWAVRAGAKLAENLRRAVAGHGLQPWRPQRDALAILGLGHGRAVAWRNGVTLNGWMAWRLKTWIDRRWMARFQRLPTPAMNHAEIPAATAEQEKPCAATASPPFPPTASDPR
jgi:selenide,water dikinase